MKLVYVTHQVHRRGGMERASAEVLERVGQRHETVVVAARCEVSAPRLRWEPVAGRLRPELFHVWDFRRRAGRVEKTCDSALVAAVNTSAARADVIVAQFCHAAFTARYGGLRGGANKLRRGYQSLAQRVFIEQERASYTSPRLKRVIAVSQGVKRELMEHYGLPAGQFSVIPNGVDHRVFAPADEAAKRELRRSLKLPAEALTCLFVGGDWDRKGLADAVRAVARVPEAVLAVVGRGDVARFGEIAARAGAEGRVHFVGASTRPQDYYAASDVFVFPTRYEAFSLATLEAAAAGLPILAPRVNGTEELIEDGVNGFFTEMNPDSIQARLVELRDDPEKRRRMSRAIHQTSLRYTWDRIAAEQMEVFEAVAARC
jgi:UDP-glucose:(heptosyl)LPS alpha-1,3-glucosyltransferase